MDKTSFLAVILGSFIGYLLFQIVNGLTNNVFYRMGLEFGKWIADILKG